jgi:hypothetical protein
MFIFTIVVFSALYFLCDAEETKNNSRLTTPAVGTNGTLGLGFCADSGSCSVGGVEGACVSISGGCCSGTVTSGLCPGSSDIKCCTSNPCSTPYGSGTCKQTSACGGTSVPGYCSGPSDVQCCVGSAPSSCILGEQKGGNCDESTITRGLSNQIIAELNSMGYYFRSLNPSDVHCSNPCTLQSCAADSLESAARSVNDFITINSAFRSSAEQYLLYNWYLTGNCGITLAASPGSSNHEGGRAIDTSNYNYWSGTLSNYGWVHSYPSSDPVHFDYTGCANIASQNLQAFQRLYNRHNSNKISEDGVYGPQTANALYNSPCNGW